MLLVALALTAVLLPLMEGREQGWPPWVWLCLAAAAVLFTGFALFERRLTARGGQPLVDLDMFSRMTPEYAGAASGVLNTGLQVGNALGVALVGVVFFGALGGGADVAGAFVAGMVYVVAVAVVLALIVQFLPRDPGSA